MAKDNKKATISNEGDAVAEAAGNDEIAARLARIAKAQGASKASWLGTDDDIKVKLSKSWWKPEVSVKYNRCGLHGYLIGAQEMTSPKYDKPFIGVLAEAASESIGEDEVGNHVVIEPGDQVLFVGVTQLQPKLVPAANDPDHVYEFFLRLKSDERMEVGKGNSMWTFDFHIRKLEISREQFMNEAVARMSASLSSKALGAGGVPQASTNAHAHAQAAATGR